MAGWRELALAAWSQLCEFGQVTPSLGLHFLSYEMVPYWTKVRVITINDSRFYLFEAYDMPDGMLNASIMLSALHKTFPIVYVRNHARNVPSTVPDTQ